MQPDMKSMYIPTPRAPDPGRYRTKASKTDTTICLRNCFVACVCVQWLCGFGRFAENVPTYLLPAGSTCSWSMCALAKGA